MGEFLRLLQGSLKFFRGGVKDFWRDSEFFKCRG